ncbi:MAG: hypothetical protein R2747_21200 [Pyrinomonadaceae bacterium]
MPRKPVPCLLIVGLIALSLFSIHAISYGTPIPQNADEYSYLLMAKTFVSGRLENPSHPMRAHFDNFHAINEPSFASKYPPAQGFILAIGLFFFGSPIVGVWLSGAAACLGTFWMLRAFCDRKWAFLGTLMTLTFPIVFAWSTAYFLGFAALNGIMLCLGALFRLTRRIKIGHSVIFGLGIAILSNSRPWEGLLACVPLSVFILIWLFGRIKDREFVRRAGLKFIVPVAAVLAVNFGWMVFYNFQVTGDPLKMPYQVYNRQYDPIPLFLPLLSPPPFDEDFRQRAKEDFLQNQITRSRIMREFHLYEFDNFYFKTLSRYIEKDRSNLFVFLSKRAFFTFKSLLWITFYVYCLILIAGICLYSKSRRFLFCFGALVFCFLVNSFATYQQPHYYAPFFGFFCAAFVFVLSRTSRLNSRLNRFVTALAVAIILMQGYFIFTSRHITDKATKYKNWEVQAVFEKFLYELPGNHLVLIDYSNANFLKGDRYLWITNRSYFNEPDIDASRIVWANSLDKQSDKKLFDYFKDRDVWVLGFGDADLKSENFYDSDARNLYPKIISCEGRESRFPPDETLKNALQRSCPGLNN